MPPKKKRADRETVERIFKEGIFLNSPVFLFKFILFKDGEKNRISFIVPKKIARLAVKRNKLKRLGYRALKEETKKLPQGIAGVFVFKKNEDKIWVLKNEIKTIFNKIN